MIIHGYGQNGRSKWLGQLKNALLDHDSYNVIVGMKLSLKRLHKQVWIYNNF